MLAYENAKQILTRALLVIAVISIAPLIASCGSIMPQGPNHSGISVEEDAPSQRNDDTPSIDVPAEDIESAPPEQSVPQGLSPKPIPLRGKVTVGTGDGCTTVGTPCVDCTVTAKITNISNPTEPTLSGTLTAATSATGEYLTDAFDFYDTDDYEITFSIDTGIEPPPMWCMGGDWTNAGAGNVTSVESGLLQDDDLTVLEYNFQHAQEGMKGALAPSQGAAVISGW